MLRDTQTRPDHGEASYRGFSRLADCAAGDVTVRVMDLTGGEMLP